MATLRPWTAEEVRALGVTTDVVTAGSILGIGRNKAYQLAREGRFPVPVNKLGSRHSVAVAHLLQALGLDA